MTYKTTFIRFFMFSIVGVAIWSTYLLYNPEKKAKRIINNLPDAFLEEVSALIMDKEGKPHLKINSPKMTHYQENNTTHLITPEITLYRDSQVPWFITARFAKAQNGADLIDFWEDVVIHHPPDESSSDTWIKTASLTVYTNTQSAETDKLIILTQPNITVQAQGMHAEMKTGKIKLLERARAEYMPDAD